MARAELKFSDEIHTFFCHATSSTCFSNALPGSICAFIQQFFILEIVFVLLTEDEGRRRMD
ncbi:transmembrane protein, putative [Medicago truncatula]|uniref:Transmembrane protein, putative n=1 Tax=Medicago truncatula TaxID=3880 RepID=A0A072VF62_MEDTR|nr:transmembrane protein, putative [Medicago truncatula]